MRDDVMLELVQRATEDADFRQRAMTDLDGTLTSEGYDLTDEELGALRELQAQLDGLSEDEVTDRLGEVQRTGVP